MRTVPGRTDRVVVVGAGLAGLAAALRLRGAGREVTVVERGAGPGGRAGRVERGGYALDTGPSVFTAPGDPGRHPRRRRREARGPADPAAAGDHLPRAVRRRLAPRRARRPRRLRRRGRRGCAGRPRPPPCAATSPTSPSSTGCSCATFIDRNLDSPLDLLGPELVALARRGGFGRLSRHVERVLRRRPAAPAVQLPGPLRRASRRSGRSPPTPSSPSSTSAPASGTRSAASPRCPARWPPPRPTPGSRSGTARPCAELETSRDAGSPPSGWRTASGCRPTPSSSPPTSRGALVPGPARPAPAGVLAVLRGPAPRRARRAARAGAPHDQLRRRRGAGCSTSSPATAGSMTDPSLLVSMPSRTDRQPGPRRRPGAQRRRARRPNLDRRSGGNPDLDWATLGPRYRDELLATLEARGWTGLTGAIEVEEMATPPDWAAQGMAAGTPFALAHTFGQTGPFRPSTLPRRGPENVVLAGSSVQPGVGVPMVLISGRLAAERITGMTAVRRPRRPQLAAAYAHCAAIAARARQELPPGHPAAHRRPPSRRARPLRRRPHRRRPRRPARRRPGRRPRRAGRRPCSPTWTRGWSDDPVRLALVRHLPPLRHPGRAPGRLPRRDDQRPRRHRLRRPGRPRPLHVGLGGGDRPAGAAGARHRPRGAPGGGRAATPSRSARRSS